MQSIGSLVCWAAGLHAERQAMLESIVVAPVGWWQGGFGSGEASCSRTYILQRLGRFFSAAQADVLVVLPLLLCALLFALCRSSSHR